MSHQPTTETAPHRPSGQSHLTLYLNSIGQFPLLDRNQERALFKQLEEHRFELTKAVMGNPDMRAKAMNLFHELQERRLDPRRHLEFGQHEGPLISRKLDMHLPTMRHLVEQLDKPLRAGEATRAIEKLTLLSSELRLKDGLLHQLCLNYLDKGPDQSVATRLDNAISIRNRIAEGNFRLVISIAKQHTQAGVEILDLIQGGNAGLIRAIERFKPSLEFTFSTYATPWITQGVQRESKRASRVVHEPMHVQALRGRVETAQRALRDRHEFSDPIAIQAWLRSEEPSKRVPSIEQIQTALLPKQEVSISDQDAPSYNAPEGIENALGINQEEVKILLSRLHWKEALVLQLRFGISMSSNIHEQIAGTIPEAEMPDFQAVQAAIPRDVPSSERTLEEVGIILGVTRERIRQIQNHGISKIKSILSNRQLKSRAPEEPASMRGKAGQVNSSLAL